MSHGILIKRSEIAGITDRHRKRGERIVFTNGIFDILHRGHVDYLAKARSFGDILIVGLNTDVSTRRIKGPSRPLQKQQDRAAVLTALRAVDYVVLFGESTPEKLIKQIKPDILVKGADYKLSEIVGADFVKSYGGQVRRVRLTKGRSTSRLLKLLSEK